MEKQRVLLISTPYMNIYKDVMEEIINKNFDVDFIEANESKWDPLNVRGYKKLRKIFIGSDKWFRKKNRTKWIKILNTSSYKHSYDYLFVIDGQSVHPILFSILKERNPKIYCINYLFDTTKGVYRFDSNFGYFDKVATFDLKESMEYNIDFLPIYWIREQQQSDRNYKMFGLGRYNESRFKLFNYLSKISLENHWEVYIKLQVVKVNLRKLRWRETLRNFIGLKPVSVPSSFYSHQLATYDSFTPMEFRRLINSSDIIVDTSAPHQDGLTARLMWALGSEKKIITSNADIKQYCFYTPEQFYIIDDIDSVDEKSLMSFMNSKYIMPEKVRTMITQYKLSNWIDLLFKL